MTDHRPVVVGVADQQSNTVDYAAREAARAQCVVRLVRAYAVPPAPPVAVAGIDIAASYRAGAQDALDAAAGLLEHGHDGLQVEAVVAKGHTPAVLERESQEARLVVIGPPARKPWYVKMFEGEVTHHLVQQAGCPVVVVPTRWHDGADEGPVVVVVDGEVTAQAALEFGHQTAHARGTELRIVHSDGSPREAALQVADEAGLLVLPASYAAKVVGEAQCPVAVVPVTYDR